MAINLYEVLNIKPTASTKEIEVAIADSEQSGIDPAMINAAKQFLLDKEKRKKYDLMLNRKPSTSKEPVSKPVKLAPPEPIVQSQPTQTNNNIKFCSSCGAKLEPNQAFCGGCGLKLGSTQNQQQTAPIKKQVSKPQKKQNSLLTMILLLFIAGFVLLSFFRGASKTGSMDSSAAAQDFNREKKSVENRVRAELKDPESAKIDVISFVKNGRATDYYSNGSKEINTDFACGTVNAKNSFGGYTGTKKFVWVSDKDRVFIDRGTEGVGDDLDDMMNDSMVESLFLSCIIEENEKEKAI